MAFIRECGRVAVWVWVGLARVTEEFSSQPTISLWPFVTTKHWRRHFAQIIMPQTANTTNSLQGLYTKVSSNKLHVAHHTSKVTTPSINVPESRIFTIQRTAQGTLWFSVSNRSWDGRIRTEACVRRTPQTSAVERGHEQCRGSSRIREQPRAEWFQ